MFRCDGGAGQFDCEMKDRDWRVLVRRLSDYESGAVRDALSELLRQWGEPGGLCRPGRTVLLKPNALGQWKPDAAITTHPQLVRQLAGLLVEAGCRVLVGDSSGGKAEAHRTMAALEVSGLAEAAREAGAEVVNFDALGAVTREVRDRTYHLARPALEADVVISMPKLKTHALTVITAATKNTYGCVPGLGKVRLHREHPDVEGFSSVVVDISEAVAPHYTIVDGVVCMQGNGPAHGEPITAGLLLGGRDQFAVDAAICAYIGVGLDRVPTVVEAARRGIGPGSIGEVVIDGPAPAEVGLAPFRLPPTSIQRVARLSPGKALARWVLGRMELVPVVDPAKCSGCGYCRDSCPQDAIRIVYGLPRFDRHNCIDCLCCCEVCPQLAVDVKPTSRVGEWLHRLGDAYRRRGG